MTTYKAAIQKVLKYVETNTFITYLDGTQEPIAIFDWRELEKEQSEFDYEEEEIDSYSEPRASQIEEYHLNDEIREKMKAGKWGLFAIAGTYGHGWKTEGFADMFLTGAVVFDLENGDEKTCPVLTVFSCNDFKPIIIANSIEELKLIIKEY